MIALPAPTAVTTPSSSTVTTDSLLDLNMAAPASLGVTVAVIVSLPPTIKFNSTGSTAKLVSFLFTDTATVVVFTA